MKSIWIVGILALAIAGFAYWYFTTEPTTDAIVLIAGSVPGNAPYQDTPVLPKSFNQPDGAVFSYSAWILFNDFTTGYGNRRKVFSKGGSPAVFLDSTSNSLIVEVETFGATESVLIPNISALKWIHLGIVVNQQAADIYVNGTLRQHHTFAQLPKQNDGGFTAGPGWNGVLGKVSYYPRALSYVEMFRLSKQEPPPDLARTISPPNYFDITWYTGRLNSS